MRTVRLIAKVAGSGVALVGATTAPADSAAFLRNIADVLEGAGVNTATALWVVTFVLIGWVAFDVFRWIRSRRAQTSEGKTRTPSGDELEEVVDYIGAVGIIGEYLEPALRGKRAGVSVAVKQDLINRFGDTTGARLGEYTYNGALLHEWMRSNAARFIVEHRGDMR